MADSTGTDGFGRDSDADRTGMSQRILAALAAHPDEMAEIVEVLHTRVTHHESLLNLMQLVTVQAVRLLPQVRWAGVTARFDDVPFTIAHTDQRVLVVDEDQYRTHDGPCLRALNTAAPVHMTLPEIRSAWSHLGDTAEDAGVQTVLALPIITRGVSVAVLNLYSDVTDGLRVVDADVAPVLTEYLRRAVQDFLVVDRGQNPAVLLRQAMHVRNLMDKAVGVVMSRHDLDSTDALALIQFQARRHGLSSEGRAEQLVAAFPDGNLSPDTAL